MALSQERKKEMGTFQGEATRNGGRVPKGEKINNIADFGASIKSLPGRDNDFPKNGRGPKFGKMFRDGQPSKGF